MKKRLTHLLCIAALCATMIFPTNAGQIGIYPDTKEMKALDDLISHAENEQVQICVTVPTVFAFTVDETTDTDLTFKNYTTKEVAGNRVGLPLEVTGHVQNQGTPASRNHWEHIGVTPTAMADDFKKYRLIVDGKNFDQEDGLGNFAMDGSIFLAAPAATGFDTNNLTTTPTTKRLDFDAKVGGTEEMYEQIRRSAKLGTIVWSIAYETK